MPFYSQNGGLITPQPSGSAGYMPAAATISQAMNPFYQSSYFAPFYQNGRTTVSLQNVNFYYFKVLYFLNYQDT